MAENPEQLALNAAKLLRAGPSERAREAYKVLLDLAPNRPNDWFNLGWIERQSGAYESALYAYDQALAYGVSGAEEVHLNRAAIYSDALFRPDLAAAELEKALAIKPDYASAWLNLGNLHEDRGSRPDAKAAYARALELEPGNALALARLADVTTFEDAGDPLFQKLRAFINTPSMPPLGKADLGFALGRGLDQAGAFDEAFSAYRAANAATAQMAKTPYDPDTHKAFIDRIVAAFPSASTAGVADKSPVFICGMFRSGSTLAERIVSAHSRITAGGELDLMPMLVARRLNPFPDSMRGISEEAIAPLRQIYLDGLSQAGLQPDGLIDKRPDNFLYIGLIKALFPDAKIINTVRNPLDNCLSVYFAHLSPELTYAHSLESAAHYYREYQRLMQHWRELYPDDIFDFNYDIMVAQPREHIGRLLGFLELDWEEACLTPHAQAGTVRTASAWQVREPLYARSSGRWQNYAGHIQPLLDAFPNG